MLLFVVICHCLSPCIFGLSNVYTFILELLEFFGILILSDKRMKVIANGLSNLYLTFLLKIIYFVIKRQLSVKGVTISVILRLAVTVDQ